MKKIYLEITPFFPTKESFRGPYIYDQVKAIERNSDFEVIVVKLVSPYQKDLPKSYEYRGVKVYNFVVYDLPSSVLPGLFHGVNLIRFENFLKKEVGVDLGAIEVIHSHVAYPAGALGVDLGKKYGIKSFVQHHGFDVMGLSNGRILKGKLKELNDTSIKKRFLKTVNHAALNIGVSQKVLDILQKIEGFSNPNSYVLYNGVDTKKFYKIENFKKDDIFTIGCIGNFWEIKDQMTLLKALDIVVNKEGVKDIKTIFIGTGETLQKCKDFVEEKSIQNYVEFRKEIEHSELNEFYNSLDLFVLPSYYEAFGCVYAEALQAGVAIVGIEGQGIEEVINKFDKETMLIKKSSSESLCDIIQYWIRHKDSYLSTYDFNIDIFLSNFLKVIQSI